MIFPIVRSKRPPIVDAQDLIRAREAQGLMWSLAARLVFVTIIVIFVVLHLLHLISPGIAAQTDRDAAGMLAIQLGAALFILYFMHLARRQTKLTVAGLGAVILDVTLVSLMGVMWFNSLSLPDGSPAFLMKDEFAVKVNEGPSIRVAFDTLPGEPTVLLLPSGNPGLDPGFGVD